MFPLCSHPWEACPFLNGHGTGVDKEGVNGSGREGTGGEEGAGTVDSM